MVFRTLQAIRDLVHLARSAPEAVLRRLAEGTPPVEMSAGAAFAVLSELVGPGHCRISGPRAMALHETLLLAATLPDDDYECFVLATMILLADRLQSGLGPDDLYWHFDAFGDHYALVDRPRAAAIRCGFHALAVGGAIGVAPGRVVLVGSRDPEALRAALCRLAEAATETDLRAIAESDEGDRTEAHLAALRSLIHRRGCLFGTGASPVPREVVELAAFVPAHRGFVAATAILLVNAITAGGREWRFAHRWMTLGQDYLDLPAPERGPLIAAIRHLYETDPEFTPYPGVQFDPWSAVARLIPPG